MSYQRNGRECFLCHIRKRLIYVTPEETVRQNLLRKLIEEHSIPPEMIAVEESLSHYQKGTKGRADIVVFYGDNETIYPLLLVECKEPNVFLNHKTIEQIEKYNSVLGAEIYGITNGTDTFWYHQKQGEMLQIEHLPSYIDILNNQNITFASQEKEFKPINYKMSSGKLAPLLKEQFIMGDKTPFEFARFIANMNNLLANESEKLISFIHRDFKLIFDGGLRSASYGNAGSGRWNGEYRYIVVEDKSNNHQIVSFSLMSSENGSSMLIVAIDDNEISHNSLQLSIDNFVTINGNLMEVWHDGRITVGNLGPAPRNSVIRFIEERHPELVKKGIIKLGVLDNSVPFDFMNADIKRFMKNLIKYVLCREEFRKEFKEIKQNTSI